MDIDNLLNRIDIISNEFINKFNEFDSLKLNWKPNSHSWSIAQNIEHLIEVNTSYFDLVKSVRAGKYKLPFTGRIRFLVNIFGKFILKGVHPDTKKKIKTFSIWEPSSSNIENILEKFEKHQKELKQFIISCNDLLKQKIVISSPANHYVVYDLYTAFDIIVTHESRHFEQAKNVIFEQNKLNYGK